MKYCFGKYVVSENEEPCCKICGEKLEYRQIYSTMAKVTHCSNKNCEGFNPTGYKAKIRAFLGEEVLATYTKNRRETNKLCPEYWLKKGFSESEAESKIKEMQSSYSKQVKNRGICDRKTIEKKLGKEEADKFFKRKSRVCVEYWTSRGYSEEEAKKKIHELQTKIGKSQDPQKARFWSHRCKEYWMTRSGMTEEEAIKIISERQRTFTKEKCIEKYGYDEGIKRWEERQNKWQETLHKSQNLHVGFSKISQKLFNDLLNRYQEQDKDYVFFGSKNHEYSLRDNDKNYIYDFTDLNKRKMIEFQGDIYHGNPLLFEETDHPNPFKPEKTSKELWEYDAEKRSVAEKNGFEILSVWETEYRKNKAETLDKIKNFLGIC